MVYDDDYVYIELSVCLVLSKLLLEPILWDGQNPVSPPQKKKKSVCVCGGGGGVKYRCLMLVPSGY